MHRYLSARSPARFSTRLNRKISSWLNGMVKQREFDRPSAEKLADWLEDYSLGEIWEKNIIGGGPH